MCQSNDVEMDGAGVGDDDGSDGNGDVGAPCSHCAGGRAWHCLMGSGLMVVETLVGGLECAICCSCDDWKMFRYKYCLYRVISMRWWAG